MLLEVPHPTTLPNSISFPIRTFRSVQQSFKLQSFYCKFISPLPAPANFEHFQPLLTQTTTWHSDHFALFHNHILSSRGTRSGVHSAFVTIVNVESVIISVSETPTLFNPRLCFLCLPISRPCSSCIVGFIGALHSRLLCTASWASSDHWPVDQWACMVRVMA